MLKESRISTIVEDLEKRGLSPTILICEDEDKMIQVLAYNEKGLVSLVTAPVKGINVSERRGPHAHAPILSLVRD